MKYSPTATLALVLAAGIAGAAAAQTTATPGAASNTPQPMVPDTQAGMNYRQPQPGLAQTPPNLTQPQPNYTETTPTPPAGAGMRGTARPGSRAAGHTQPEAAQAGLQNFTPDQVRTAQEQLQAAGIYTGPTDGLMDPDTRAAIARFQQQNGMRRTATLDQPTLDRLVASRTVGSGSGMPGAPAAAPNINQEETAAPMGAPLGAPAGAGGNNGKSGTR